MCNLNCYSSCQASTCQPKPRRTPCTLNNSSTVPQFSNHTAALICDGQGNCKPPTIQCPDVSAGPVSCALSPSLVCCTVIDGVHCSDPSTCAMFPFGYSCTRTSDCPMNQVCCSMGMNFDVWQQCQTGPCPSDQTQYCDPADSPTGCVSPAVCQSLGSGTSSCR